MKNTNKKGFTIVELVIVIAVIAILAGVLIPTFVSLVRKANISADTQVAKNLNNAAISEQADTFDKAYSSARDFGYLVANLNAKTEGCYFVWEDDTNQFLLYDLTTKEIIYSNTAVSGDPDESWFFAVNNTADEAAVKAVWANVTTKMLVGDIKDIANVIANGGEIYIDESLVLDAENLLVFNKVDGNSTINLGNAQLNTSGTLDDIIPIQVNAGTVTINGGVIGAAGSGVDLDGKVYSTPISDKKDTTLIINDTQFNTTADGCVQFQGTATLNRVKANTYIYSYGNGNVTLNDCEVTSSDIAIWVTNTIVNNGTTTYDGTSTLTVNSGKYDSTVESAGWGTVSVYGGTINVKGGDFTSKDGHMFAVLHDNGKIVITGGTFNGVAFEAITDWNALCASGEATVSADGKTVTITK